jgi:gliding motility-associated-like protein
LYVNGKLKTSNTANKRVNIDNRAPFSISSGPCIGTTDKKFQGFIDELKIFRAALTDLQIENINIRPDEIYNRDTIIFLGTSVKLNLTKTCAKDFVWSPKNYGIDDEKAASPTITPTQSGSFLFEVAIKEQSCTSVDSIRIKVVDPKELPCTRVYVPNAFTPNGDGLNDELHISNPYAIEALVNFEVLDSWGGRLFQTTDRFGKWDGTFNGTKLNPGVYLWKARFRCQGQEYSNFGSVTILK